MPTFGKAPILTAADKLVTLINAETWTQSVGPAAGNALVFEAERVYTVPDLEPADFDTLRVYLVPFDDEEEILLDRFDDAERSDEFVPLGIESEFVFAIAVLKNLTDKDQRTEADVLVNFTKALSWFFGHMERITASSSLLIHCTDRQVVLTYSPEELEKNSRFFSVIHYKFAGQYV